MLDLESYRLRAHCNRRLAYTLELIEEIEQLRAKVRATESTLTDAQELLNLSLDGSDALRRQLATAERERDEQTERAEKAEALLGQESSEMVDGLVDQNKKIIALRQQLAEANAKLAGLESYQQKAEVRLDKLAKERDDLYGKVGQLKRQLAAAQAECGRLRETLETVEAGLSLHSVRKEWMADMLLLIRAALSQPSTAGERWEAMERLCIGAKKSVAIRYRQKAKGERVLVKEVREFIHADDDMIAALDALAALEKGE